jgi:hypothetical protein
MVEFLWFPQACAQEVPMTEKKCLIAAFALIDRAGPILSSSWPSQGNALFLGSNSEKKA